MRLCELKEKEVVNICNGKCLGGVVDLQINVCSGAIEALIVPEFPAEYSLYSTVSATPDTQFHRRQLLIYKFSSTPPV